MSLSFEKWWIISNFPLGSWKAEIRESLKRQRYEIIGYLRCDKRAGVETMI